MCLLLNRALLTGLTLKSLLCRSSRTDSLINQLAVGSRFQSLRCSCWTGMLCFPPEPCTVTTPASRTQHPDLASCLALEWADFEMVFCLLYDGLSFFSSSLLPLPPGIVKFISLNSGVGFLLKCCLDKSNDGFFRCLYCPPDSSLCSSASNKNLFAVFLTHLLWYLFAAVSLQCYVTGQILSAQDTENGTQCTFFSHFRSFKLLTL